MLSFVARVVERTGDLFVFYFFQWEQNWECSWPRMTAKILSSLTVYFSTSLKDELAEVISFDFFVFLIPPLNATKTMCTCVHFAIFPGRRLLVPLLLNSSQTIFNNVELFFSFFVRIPTDTFSSISVLVDRLFSKSFRNLWLNVKQEPKKVKSCRFLDAGIFVKASIESFDGFIQFSVTNFL